MKKLLFALVTFSLFGAESHAEMLKAIKLVAKSDQVASHPELPPYTVSSEHLFLLQAYPGFLDKLQSNFIGKPLTQDLLLQIEGEIVSFYRSKGQPFVSVTVPHQELKSGSVQLVVTEPTFGEVTFKGNQNSSPDQLKKMISQKSGAPIDGNQLVKEMNRMNKNPFRRTDAVWKAGKKAGTADLELDTIDRFPYRFYMGADNTGTVQTERDRFFFGVNLGKTIVNDSEFSYQFTCSPNWNKFIAQTALCRVPFPARQTFIFYGGYAKVEPDLAGGNREKTISWQVDGRYRIPVITNSLFLQEILLGYDFKQIIGKVRNSGEKLFYGVADVDQFMVGYDAGLKGPVYRLTLVAELLCNPGWLSKHNTTDDYEKFVAHSGPGYVYGKLSHSFAYCFRNWWVSYDVNGQLSSKNLLPSEQFTLAGYNAVRGFEERILNTDNAILLNLTLQTPRISIGKLAGWSKEAFDELYFHAFFDYGLGGNHLVPVGHSKTQSLASIGPGIRYQIDRYVTARFDYGFQLFHNGFNNPTNSRYNFGVIASF